MKHTSLLFLACFAAVMACAQLAEYKLTSIGFYNLENLFDTLDSEETRDTEFILEGRYGYTTAVYQKKNWTVWLL